MFGLMRVVGATLSLLAILAPGTLSAANKQPNFLLIMVDDMGW
mgnify:CR=1 FL=1